MNKKRIPDYYIKSIFALDPTSLRKIGIRYIFTDLDNTLDSYKMKIPSQKTKDFIKACIENDVSVVIFSNNKYKRVKNYVDVLGVDMVSMCYKPSPKKILSYMTKNRINNKEVVFIGDQIFTDIEAGKRAKITTILTERLTNDDQWFTKIRRIFEKPLVKKIKRNYLTKEWDV